MKSLVVSDKSSIFATANKTMVNHPVGANGNRSLIQVGYFCSHNFASYAIDAISAAVQKEDCPHGDSVVLLATGRAAVPFSNRLSETIKVMEEEIWKDIEGCEGKYQVSNLGRVRSHNKGYREGWHILTPFIQRYGYLAVKLYHNDGSIKTYSLHRLVAMAFVDGYKPDLVVNHKDQNHANNRADNLEWITQAENTIYADVRERRAMAHKKQIEQIDADGVIVGTFSCSADARRLTGISRTNIVLCCCGKRDMAGGYYWRYSEQIRVKIKNTPKKVRNLPGEVWKDIEGYEGLYKVSNMGRIMSLKPHSATRPLLRTTRRKGVRSSVTLIKDGVKKPFKVYRLVAYAFCPGYAPGLHVNHKDENVNNDRADNLEWLTPAKNYHYGTRFERSASKQRKPVIQLTKDGDYVAEHQSLTVASIAVNGNVTNIARSCEGKYISAYGYKWLFKSKYESIIKKKKQNGKPL